MGSEGGGKREESNLNGIESIGIGARGRARGRFDDEVSLQYSFMHFSRTRMLDNERLELDSCAQPISRN